MTNAIIKKHNVLNTASYSFTLAEQRLVWLAIIGTKQPQITPDQPIRVHASAYAEHFDVTRQGAHHSLSTAATQLFDRRFSYREINENGNEQRVLARWVNKVVMEDSQGVVSIHFSSDVIGFIKDLQDNFSWFEIEQVAKLDSFYAGRLYELLSQWRSVLKTPKIELEELRSQLGVQPDQYLRMSDFKKRVLDLAVTEISKNTDIIASYEQFKRGRIISHIQFSFKFRKTPAEIQVKKPKKPAPLPYGEQVIDHLNMTRDAAGLMASKMSFLSDTELPAELIKLPPPKRANAMLNKLCDPQSWQELMPQLKAAGYTDLLD